jgi:hypothetical protein
MSLAFLLLPKIGYGADSTVERFVELRDGSILRLPVVDEAWKVTVVQKEGKLAQATMRLSEVEAITLTPERTFEKKKALIATILQLGSDEFDDRENAQRDLIRMGGPIRADLELLRDRFTDLEIKTRLANVLGKIPPENKPAEFQFDTFEGKETLWGDGGDVAITILAGGKQFRLGRKEVLGITVKRPNLAFFRHGAGTFRQIGPEDFPPGCIEEGFETSPEGRKLNVGENVEKVFVKKGFTLSTSIKTSFVSVNSFEVHGKTKGLSCANHEPLWHGEITITFCQPGNEKVPAGVNYFGTWIAYVEVNGTALHAYDVNGREIGKVAVRKREHDFLAFYSPVPIHKVRVVPNLQIDPDYTLDDFIFSPARSFEPTHPDHCLVQLAGGEQLLCANVEFSSEGLTLKGMPAGLPDASRPFGDILRVFPPDRKEKTAKPTPGVFVELQDGSVLFGSKPGEEKAGPVFARKPDVLKQPENIVGLWGSTHARPVWPAEAPSIAIAEEGKGMTWKRVARAMLESDHVAHAQPADENSLVERPYHEMPPLMMKARAGKEAAIWRVRTTNGEELALGADGAKILSGTVKGSLMVKWDGKEIKLTVDDIAWILGAAKE